MTFIKYFLLFSFWSLCSASAAFAVQDHLCIDLNGNTSHASVPCNKMGMLDAASQTEADQPYTKMQCPGLGKNIAQLQAAIAQQDKLFKTPYSSVKQDALQRQLTARRQQYQTQCAE
jgi:hypothetical protein